MRRITITIAVVSVWSGQSAPAAAQRWQDATAKCMGVTAEWSNKAEVADVDGDGLVDILVANGGNYDLPGAAEPARIWRNLGAWDTATTCTEISSAAVLGFTGSARVIKTADVDRDGDLDIVTGGAWQTQLQLYLREGAVWVDGTVRLPQQLTSAGDLEFGDVDGDGDLDLLIAEWGAVPPGSATPPYEGGRTRLYVNDGAGTFTDATAAQMPEVLVKWSWDAELVDIDQDWDLDALVSCKLCDSNFVFRNNGIGAFTHDPDALPAFTNNYDFEPMDIDHDGDLDLMTINSDAQFRDRLLVNNGSGVFTDESATRLLGDTNPAGTDDNAAAFLDVDADGDADLFVISLNRPDRLMINDGAGVFTLSAGATPNDTRGSLGVALVDLNGDGRLDVVQSQGEIAGSTSEKVQLASDAVAIDTVAPLIARHAVVDGRVVARIHDHQSPSRPHDWQRVWLESGSTTVELAWYGEYLWRATAASLGFDRLCARDRRGNEACVTPAAMPPDGAPDAGVQPQPDAGDGGGGGGGGGGGCCQTGSGAPVGPGALAVLLAFALRRTRQRRDR